MRSELLEIKRQYDRDALVSDVLPDLVAAHPQRYAGVKLPELCDEMHELLRERQADRLQRAAYNADREPEVVLRPADGHLALLRDGAELVPLDELAGRVAAALIVVYPPGTALMVPGERFAADSAAVAYLRLFEESDNRFPGFECEMQGIFPRAGTGGRLRYFTYVVPQTAAGGG